MPINLFHLSIYSLSCSAECSLADWTLRSCLDSTNLTAQNKTVDATCLLQYISHNVLAT